MTQQPELEPVESTESGSQSEVLPDEIKNTLRQLTRSAVGALLMDPEVPVPVTHQMVIEQIESQEIRSTLSEAERAFARYCMFGLIRKPELHEYVGLGITSHLIDRLRDIRPEPEDEVARVKRIQESHERTKQIWQEWVESKGEDFIAGIAEMLSVEPEDITTDYQGVAWPGGYFHRQGEELVLLQDRILEEIKFMEGLHAGNVSLVDIQNAFEPAYNAESVCPLDQPQLIEDVVHERQVRADAMERALYTINGWLREDDDGWGT